MRALVMAAGLGTRLRPLTNQCPKPLVPLLNRPMVEYVLDVLRVHGVSEAIINIHYLPEKMHEFVEHWNRQGKLPYLQLQDESAEILGSGGAVALAAKWLFEKDEDALICNADVVANPNLSKMFLQHKDSGLLCTMAATPHPLAGIKYNGLRVENGLVTAFEKTGKNEGLFHFPGFYLVNKRIEAFFASVGMSFSILPIWESLIEKKQLGAWCYDGIYLDLGTVDDLRKAEQVLKENPWPL